MHPERRRRRQHQLTLAERGEWEAVYRNAALWEFAPEFRLGFQIAFLAPFAVPSLARALVKSGAIVTDPTRRAYHTALITYELLSLGLDSDRGRSFIRHVNHAHRGLPNTGEEMAFVLDALTTLPIRFADAYGARPVLDVERQASARFHHRLGLLMGIPDPAETWEAAAARFDEYAFRHTVPSPEGRILGDATLRVIRRRLPPVARPMAKGFIGALVPEPARSALGLPRAWRLTVALVHGAARARVAITSRRYPPTTPAFVPGQPAGVIYPDGYTLSDLIGNSTGP